MTTERSIFRACPTMRRPATRGSASTSRSTADSDGPARSCPGTRRTNRPPVLASPLKGYQAGADPVVRAGTHGLFYYSGLVFDRGEGGKSGIFLTRFIDTNGKENGDTVSYLGTSMVATSTGAAFLDKPWMAVDIPRSNNPVMCVVGGTPGGAKVKRNGHKKNGRGNSTNVHDDGLIRVPGGAVYVAYTSITGDGSTPFAPKSSSSARLTAARPGARRCASPAPQTRSIKARSSRLIPMTATSSSRGAVLRVPLSPPPTPSCWPACRSAAARSRSPGRGAGVCGNRIAVGGAREYLRTPQEAGATARWWRRSRIPIRAPRRTASGPTPIRRWRSTAAAGSTWRGPSAATPSSARARSTATHASWWPPPLDAVSFTAPVIAANEAFGHQLMPSLAFAGGKLMLVYYDLRETAAQVFGKYVTDQISTNGKRQTIDIRASLATAGPSPVFAPSVKVSDYLMGYRNSADGARTAADQPAQPADVQAGHGSVHRRLHRPDRRARVRAGSRWAMGVQHRRRRRPFPFSTPPGPTTATCARRSTAIGRITHHRPSWEGTGQSLFDPSKQVAVCHAGNAGSRNQNIYTARIGGGLLVGSPGNAKQLSTGLQRGFVVFAQNDTTTTKTFRMTVLAQPVGGRASFEQFPLPPYTASSPAPTTVSRCAGAGAVHRVEDALRHLDRSESTGLRGRVGSGRASADRPSPTAWWAVSSSIPTSTTPTSTIPTSTIPTSTTRTSTMPRSTTPTSTIPTSTIPTSTTPTSTTPTSTTPTSTTCVSPTPTSTTSASAIPTSTTRISTTRTSTTRDIDNPDIDNGTISDVTWTVSNIGNTTAAFNVNLFLANAGVPAGIRPQLIVYKTYKTPVLDARTAVHLRTETRNVLMFNVNNPDVHHQRRRTGSERSVGQERDAVAGARRDWAA